MNRKPAFTLVVGTCNNYASLWPAFSHFLLKYWPGFNMPIISSASIPLPIPGSRCVKNGRASFSSRLIKAVRAAKTDLILLTLEDFFLMKEVDQQYIEAALRVLRSDSAVGCITLHDDLPEAKCTVGDYNDLFGFRDDGQWRVNTQFSLWRRAYLLRLLRKGESAWDFETFGTERSLRYSEKILYRKDGLNQCISYPKGGVVWGGRLRDDDPLTNGLLREYMADTGNQIAFFPTQKPKKKSNKLKKKIRGAYLKLYFHFMARIRFMPFWP